MNSSRYPPYNSTNIKLTQVLLASRWLPMVSDFKGVGGFILGAAATAAVMHLW